MAPLARALPHPPTVIRSGHAPAVVVVMQIASTKQAQFVAAVAPYAKQVAAKTGVSVKLIISQWALESGWSATGVRGGRYNLAGITKGASLESFSSLAAFATRYEQVLLGSTYIPVRLASGAWAQELALKASPWAQDHYVGKGLGSILAGILEVAP